MVPPQEPRIKLVTLFDTVVCSFRPFEFSLVTAIAKEPPEPTITSVGGLYQGITAMWSEPDLRSNVAIRLSAQPFPTHSVGV